MQSGSRGQIENTGRCSRSLSVTVARNLRAGSEVAIQRIHLEKLVIYVPRGDVEKVHDLVRMGAKVNIMILSKSALPLYWRP